ncbi:zinc finger protein 628 isoform X1 [Vanessa atalanta]|uniref:zinc finger protein 628 isoform X1 n=1 Tax=Vanessa atalanta TaxID=42275 RepID=UPI001FCD0B92|nr:zinc finger protein 628 isoform X1 [Vanessa atalanta]XP_047533648.1 zinc finger protein 628 isoform X1 [Vanessa atalanta]XP_047533649.1 zinc finger protein 628 isoform X1 [Vanessa atalanta]
MDLKDQIKMEGEDFHLHWEEDVKRNIVASEEVICGLDNVQNETYTNMTEEIIEDTDQMAAENLMYLSQDVVTYTESAELAQDPNVECVTEEVVTDDWVISGGQESFPFRVEVPLEHLANPIQDIKIENDIDVPLPTDQDEYTAMRPWPCDFCSRRFRKKAALMNHMVAHQNDRPHACNLCGVRYVRKCDLMNHLKVHAFVPDNPEPTDYQHDEIIAHTPLLKTKKKRGRRKKTAEPVEEQNGVRENMTSARTQQWSRRARAPSAPPPAPPSPSPSPPPPPTPPLPADPSRPFVCRHCGVGFAREKALQSHSRVHGGDSPVECGECGELCWSREALRSHAASRHPHLAHAPSAPKREPSYDDCNSGDDMEFRLSPLAHSGSERGERERDRERGTLDVRGPELFCGDCGVAFQRADLLRRHVAAAHSYKRHDSTSSTWEQEHTCDVCGESCPDALQLLAHAERHAERPRTNRMKRLARGRNNTSSNSRQFPCRECGKVFGSRSSQQIHIRIHTGERPYACRFCWKAFADGGTLRKHERIHTGEKPYACAVCPRAFNQRVVLREHVRSHHSAPDRRANGGYQYCCVVCGRPLHSSAELVQHLIQHCDENTALKRQPQNGPRKYKRRRKARVEESPVHNDWERATTPSPARSASPAGAPSPSPSPPRPTRATRAPRAYSPPRRRRRRAPPPPRPKMIHTEEPRPRTKQVRSRRPPRHPADDLRAIGPHSPSPAPASPVPSPPSPSHLTTTTDEGPYKCEMCSLEFPRRDALLLHVPVHI